MGLCITYTHNVNSALQLLQSIMLFLMSVYVTVMSPVSWADTLHPGFIGVENSLRLYLPGCC